MDLWDRDALDLLGPAFIEFGENHTGRFRFIAVEASMDCRDVVRGGRPAVEFSWDRNDECDPASVRRQMSANVDEQERIVRLHRRG